MAIRRCPYCKAIIDESQKYCNNCGTQLLFPADEADEEPIKGEKIVDEDFGEVVEDEDEAGEDDRLLTKDEAQLEEIDLEQVLEGGGHFPDESEAEEKPKPKPKPGRVTPPPAETPAGDPELEPAARPVRRAAAKPAPKAVRKPAAAKPKLDTKEEIAKLIAVLEEKEQRKTEPADAEPKPFILETFPPPPAPDPEPVPPVMERKPGLDAAWEELLRKPPTVDVDGDKIEIPRIPDTSPEESLSEAGRLIGQSFRGDAAEGIEDEDRVLEPAASMAPGDTMDFQQEVLARTPLEIPRPPQKPPAAPTRMGMPERITREEIFQDRDENETPPESVFDDLRLRPSPPTPSTAELLDREPPGPRRRLGFFRKTAALIFDAAFIAAIWGLALWLAGRLMGLGLPELLAAAPVTAGILLAALLGGYFFLFLFFLGETLGDRMASRKS